MTAAVVLKVVVHMLSGFIARTHMAGFGRLISPHPTYTRAKPKEKVILEIQSVDIERWHRERLHLTIGCLRIKPSLVARKAGLHTIRKISR